MANQVVALDKDSAIQVCKFNGLNVYVYERRLVDGFGVAVDFCVDGLFFVVLDEGLWAIECADGMFAFDGSELIKVLG